MDEDKAMISRRRLLETGLTAGGAWFLAARLAPMAEAAAQASGPPATNSPIASPQSPFGAYLEITPQGVIRITCPQSEMGQGVFDGLPKILAEDLEADWADVEVRLPTADDAFINPITKRHRTANSESTTVYTELLRRIGASARVMLVGAAAARWSVSPDSCRAQRSRVLHVPTGRTLSYGELAVAAASQPIPVEVKLKDVSEFTLIGRALPRKAAPIKVDGSAVFGIDVQRPGLLHAALRRSDAVSATLKRFDREAALRLPGVVDAFVVKDGVAVLASNTWQAQQAASALDVEFDESAVANLDTAGMRERLHRALDDDAKATVGRAFTGGNYDREGTLAALASAPTTHTWTYEVPFLAHAALEPLCATAEVHGDRAEVWAPTQQPDRTRDAIAEITGLPRERCTLHVTLLGGGFGRKWETDFVRQAIEIANQRRGTPIKLTWTREQDFLHDKFRPAHVARSRVGIDRDGKLLALHTRITGISMWRYQRRRMVPGMADPFATGLLINDRYDIPKTLGDYVETPEPVPVGTWRSVAQSMNGFFSESAIDDYAAVTRQDPLALRLALSHRDPRSLGVLRRVGEMLQWSRRRPKGRGLGVAISLGYDSFCAHGIEVSVTGKRVRIERIVAAFDCGQIVDPRSVEAQVEGGIIWGLSAALTGEITFVAGRAEQSNFHTAPILRLTEIPRIEVALLASDHASGGAGEASVPGVAPALAGAIQAATGERPRRLPLVALGYEFV